MKSYTCITAFICIISFFIINLYADDFSSWTKSKDMVLNTSSSGANFAKNIQNLPIKIELTESNFNFNEAKNNGEDLRFALADGTPLTYVIDKYDKANKVAEILVMVPSVAGNNRSQFIKMYWGNSSASASGGDVKTMVVNHDYVGVCEGDNEFKIINKANDNTVNLNEGMDK